MNEAVFDKRPEQQIGTGHRLPVIIQAEAAECGLACLAMVLCFHGLVTDLSSIRRRFSVSNHGTSLKSLIELGGRLHLSSRALSLESGEVPQLQLPCILHWDMNHFVVLKKVGARRILVHDPAIGARSLSWDEFNEHFTGVALELTPTADFEKREVRQKLRLRQFWSQITGLKRTLGIILLLSLVLQLFAVVSPLYMQTVVDDVILRSDKNLLLVLALGFGLLMLIQTATEALREFVILSASSRLNIQMAANLFRHLIRLPMDYFTKRHMGDIVSRFGSLENVRELLTTGLVAAIVDGVMALITLGAMFYYDSKLALIVIFFVVVYAALRIALYAPYRRLTEESIVAWAKHDSHFMESMRAIQTIKLFQRENDRQSQWQNLLAGGINRNIRVAKWDIGYGAANGVLFGLENIIVVYFAALSVMSSSLTVGMLFAFMSFKGRFVSSMEGLIGKYIELKMLGLHLDRLSDIAFTPAEDVDSLQPRLSSPDSYSVTAPNTIVGKIEARALAYQYGELDRPVFRDIHLSIEAGESVVIVGPSGCGKTSLIKCLMGLYQPSEGDVLVDGLPLAQQREFRSQIGSVMQDDQLMSGDIASNIGCFEAHIDLDRVMECAQLCKIHDEIMQLPMQYNTFVGDMGSGLSGGQQQRIMLARALYRNPRILFLDEATSHLDIANEREINESIGNLKITRIVVAHRPETIAQADKKIILEV